MGVKSSIPFRSFFGRLFNGKARLVGIAREEKHACELVCVYE